MNTRIGSGSDHTVFLNFLGRPVIGLEFDGPYGVYHSMYDDFYWMNHFGDPGYRYHAAMSQLWGVTALRLAKPTSCPSTLTFTATPSTGSSPNWKEQALRARETEPRISSQSGPGTRIHGSANSIAAQSRRSVRKARCRAARGDQQFLMKGEANFILPEGIPGRPWFKHILYSARYTYAHLELPAITEAVEVRRLDGGPASNRNPRGAITPKPH